MDKLLLETDCPVYYGRETKYRSVPADVTRSLGAVAQLKGVDQVTIAEQTTRNAIGLFSLPIAIANSTVSVNPNSHCKPLTVIASPPLSLRAKRSNLN